MRLPTEKKYELLLSPCYKIGLDYATAIRAGELMRKFSGNNISFGDAIIAATAEKYNLTICTRDRDFKLIAEEAKIITQRY